MTLSDVCYSKIDDVSNGAVDGENALLLRMKSGSINTFSDTRF